MSAIDPTARVHPDARIGEDVTIGAFADIRAHAEIGAHSTIGNGTVIHSHTVLGEHCVVSEHASIGGDPQHRKFDPTIPSGTVLGPHCRIREFVTIHRATERDGTTRLGADCYVMATAHIAHDCVLGDGVTMVNGAMIAGHCEVGDHAFFGGLAAVHQHVRIGRVAMVGACDAISRDVPPYAMTGRDPAAIYGINRLGLTRIGITGAAYKELARAWLAMRDGASPEEIPGTSAEVAALRVWLAAPSKRGIMAFRDRHGRHQAASRATIDPTNEE